MVETIDERLQGFIRKITAEANKNCADINSRTFMATIGKKYFKIVQEQNYDGSRSVFCFVDRKTGDIFKAASWKQPAKHPRGSIFDENFSWGKGVGPYGAVYLR
ncbi:Uncharacterised protein [uncultured archaeon]|nr:Uncharacterised protein [uncultured archaeon]